MTKLIQTNQILFENMNYKIHKELALELFVVTLMTMYHKEKNKTKINIIYTALLYSITSREVKTIAKKIGILYDAQDLRIKET